MEHSAKEIDEAVKKIQNRSATRRRIQKCTRQHKLQEELLTNRRHKSRGKRGPLTLEDRIKLVHKVVCSNYTQDDVAR